MIQLIAVFSFITMFLMTQLALRYTTGMQKTIYRLKKYINIDEIKEEKRRPARNDLRSGLNMLAKGVGSLRLLDGYKKSIQLRLNKAHIPLKSEEFITICMILFLAFGLGAFLISGALSTALLAGMAGWLIPLVILKSKIRKRVKQFNEQLSDAITLISNSLKAGYSFFQAADIVAKEMTGPIAEEFTLMQKEINLGLTTEKALENLAGRVGSDDMELVVTAVLIQRQVGGNLAEVLDNISSTIRDRIKIKGEVRTVTAQGRMSGLIISLLPPVLGVLIYMINPEHMGILFNNSIGLCIVVFSIFMELIGIYFINKIVRIEV
jgi:tight adherence protein B